jgi:hypothetical protein
MTEITTEELGALKEFAKKYGPDWKRALNDCWIKGSDVNAIEDGHLLRRVRNKIGPSGLADIEFVENGSVEFKRPVSLLVNSDTLEFLKPK